MGFDVVDGEFPTQDIDRRALNVFELEPNSVEGRLTFARILRDSVLKQVPRLFILPEGHPEEEAVLLRSGKGLAVVRQPARGDDLLCAVRAVGREVATLAIPPAAAAPRIVLRVGTDPFDFNEEGVGNGVDLQIGCDSIDAAARLGSRFVVNVVVADVTGLSALDVKKFCSSFRGAPVIAIERSPEPSRLRSLFLAGAADVVAADEAAAIKSSAIALLATDSYPSSIGDVRTDRKKQELERMNDVLRSTNKAIRDANLRLEQQGVVKDEALSIAAHELKSPLAAMSGAIEMLCETPDRFDTGDLALLELVERNTARMIKLVDDILDLARLDGGRVELRRRELNLASAIEQAILSVVVRADAKNVTISVEPPPEQLFQLDEGRLVQMLVNLLDNAVKFSPPGSTVRLRARLHRDRLHIVVSDSGDGIPHAERWRIFDRFQHKARGGDPASGGSGLGLTITRALARLHGGEVTVDDSEDGGARFTISLPITS